MTAQMMRRLLRIVEVPDSQERLTEGFGTPVKWHITKQSDSHFEVSFRIEKVLYEVSLFRYDRKNDGWEFGFTAATSRKQYGYSASGTGNAWTVFGTIIDIASKFIALKQPKVIKIESDITERSRVAVNRRLAKAIAQNLPYKIEDEHHFIFLRRVGSDEDGHTNVIDLDHHPEPNVL